MSKQLFANNAKSTLSAGITSVATSLTVASGDGALFPAITGGDFFLVTLEVGSTREIVQVTARAADTFTVVRGREGTTASAFAPGDAVELRDTKGTFEALRDLNPHALAFAAAN